MTFVFKNALEKKIYGERFSQRMRATEEGAKGLKAKVFCFAFDGFALLAADVITAKQRR